METEHVVVATADPQIAEHAARWCAAAGVAAQPCGSLDATRRAWRSARLVLLGRDIAVEVARAGWSRRDQVHLVAPEPDTSWRLAVEVGAVGVIGIGDDSAAVQIVGQALDDRSEGCSIAVVGGSGGVGATTFAVALCLEAARRDLTAAVVDADPVGPGVDLIAGAESVEGLRWSSLVGAGGRVAPDSLAGALPRRHGVAAVSWGVDEESPALPEAAAGVWSAAVRAFDLVVVDQAAPRPDCDDAWSPTVLGGSALTVLVVADDVAGVAAARRRAAWLRPKAVTVAGVVAARRGGLGSRAVEDAVGVPVVSRIRRDRRLRAAIDHGRGPGRSRALSRPARDVLDLVGLERSTSR